MQQQTRVLLVWRSLPLLIREATWVPRGLGYFLYYFGVYFTLQRRSSRGVTRGFAQLSNKRLSVSQGVGASIPVLGLTCTVPRNSVFACLLSSLIKDSPPVPRDSEMGVSLKLFD
jgi:hypothetical protein